MSKQSNTVGESPAFNRMDQFFDEMIDKELERHGITPKPEDQEEPEGHTDNQEPEPQPEIEPTNEEQNDELPQSEQSEEDEQPEQNRGEQEESEEEDDSDPLPKLDEEETPKPEPTESEEDDDPLTPPKFKKRLDRAKERAAKDAEERVKKEFESKVAELEAKLQQLQSEKPEDGTQHAEALKDAEREEFEMLRRRYAAESDPEIRQRYDEPMESHKETIYDTISKHFNHPDDDQARKNFAELYRNNPKQAQQVIESIRERSPIDADLITQSLANIHALDRSKKRALAEASKASSSWFEKRQKQLQAEQEQQVQSQQKQIQEYRNQMQRAVEEIKSSTRFQDVPTQGLDGEKLKEAERTNKVRQRMRKAMDYATSAKDLEQGLRIATSAALSVELQDQVQRQQERIKELEAKIQDRQKAGTVGRQRATAPTQTKQNRRDKKPTGNWLENIDNEIDQITGSSY